MSNAEKMSQLERNEKHRLAHPEDEAWRKDKQRHRDSVLRFHIRRQHLYGYEIPALLDQSTDAFKRVRDEYIDQVKQEIEVTL
jgi:hypothetical protein